MYLHIGNDVIIKKENIIFILNYDVCKDNKIYQEFITKTEITNTVENEENIKSVIIVKDKEKTKAYLSNISSVTLAKR